MKIMVDFLIGNRLLMRGKTHIFHKKLKKDDSKAKNKTVCLCYKKT